MNLNTICDAVDGITQHYVNDVQANDMLPKCVMLMLMLIVPLRCIQTECKAHFRDETLHKMSEQCTVCGIYSK